MELNQFKDLLFDLINESDADILDIFEDDPKNLLWVVMGNGAVFRIQCNEEPLHLFRKPET